MFSRGSLSTITGNGPYKPSFATITEKRGISTDDLKLSPRKKWAVLGIMGPLPKMLCNKKGLTEL